MEEVQHSEVSSTRYQILSNKSMLNVPLVDVSLIDFIPSDKVRKMNLTSRKMIESHRHQDPRMSPKKRRNSI